MLFVVHGSPARAGDGVSMVETTGSRASSAADPDRARSARRRVIPPGRATGSFSRRAWPSRPRACQTHSGLAAGGQLALQEFGQVRDRVGAVAVLPDQGRGAVEAVDAVPLPVVDHQLRAHFLDQ
jgi:hypothetical protein